MNESLSYPNTGLGRMGQISDIGYNMLASTSDNFIRLETLRDANDLVTNAIAELPIFREYNIGNVIHSSSDGQKFETGLSTIPELSGWSWNKGGLGGNYHARQTDGIFGVLGLPPSSFKIPRT